MSVVTDRIGIPTPRNLMTLAIAEVATAHKVAVSDICKGGNGPRVITRARHAAIVKVHAMRPNLSYPQLGRLFNLDHSSVMSALRKAGVWKRRTQGNLFNFLPKNCGSDHDGD